jgi:hypothetical protein
MSKLYPGWKMSVAQHYSYFNLLEAVYRQQGITSAAEKESMRKLIHTRAFGRPISAKEIDPLKGFDALKRECLAWSQPDNLNAQLRMEQMPLIRLRHRIRELADEPYIVAIIRDRFKQGSLEDLNETELEQLRNTLCGRKTRGRRASKPEPVAVTADPDWTV